MSKFSGGVAWADGGAFEMMESIVNVRDSRVELNSASSGGAVKVSGSNGTLDGVDFNRNVARNVGGVMDAFLSNMTITNCVFRRNKASNVGGVLNGFQSRYDTNSSTFEGNFAEGSGGVVALKGDKTYMYDVGSKFQNNTAYNGGAFNLEDAAYAHLKGSIIRGNNCTGNGAAARVAKGHLYLEATMAINNTAIPEGAAFMGENGFIDTFQATFQNHSAKNGPVMELHNTSTRLKSTLFRFNKAKAYAGAIWIENSPVDMDNVTFYKNRATKGGALYIENQVTEEDEESADFMPRYITIRNSLFESNVALDAGGAIEISHAVNVTTDGTVFLKNNASDFGGAVHVEDSNVTFIGTKFVQNKAKFGAAIEGYMSEFKVRRSKNVVHQIVYACVVGCPSIN